jgi:hypothetical protein
VLGWAVRLGAEVPFARAAFWLEELTGVVLSPATVRRLTEAVGATAGALAEAEVDRLERETPAPLCTPERLVLGADGAMVPLVGGEWAEVKLLSVGVPAAALRAALGPSASAPAATGNVGGPGGASALPTLQQVSYCARLADAETFGRQALAEVHRRGVEAAGAVAAVQDGAPWLQGFVDLHRPDAVRILDWPHAAQHLSAVAEAVFGVQTPRAGRVAERLRRWLWEEGPDRVVAVLAGWERADPDRPGMATAVAYFRERRAQLAYPAFRAAGWPVGSGATESGHKQVMQARMKRAGMRWARAHVNPLLALSLLEHNGRWPTEGPALLAAHRHHRQPGYQRPRGRAGPAHAERCSPPRTSRPTSPAPTSPAPTSPAPTSPAPTPASAPVPPPVPIPSPFRHPWRRYGTPLSTTN